MHSMAVNEFRRDLVSGDWTLIAPGRARRPDASENRHEWEDSYQRKEDCPFEDPAAAGAGELLLVREGIFVIRNKYPALAPGVCGQPMERGPFLVQVAHGFHELVITRDHERHFAQFTDQETAQVLAVYQERYRAIAQDECGDYISIFHNHRREAGASIWHHHSQILSTPVVPPEVLRSLEGADQYFQQHGQSVHGTLIRWELAQKERIVAENERFVLFCPFVSKTPYEMRIFPKEHSPRYELTSAEDLLLCARLLNTALRALDKALADPPFNFYIHTAPVQKDSLINYDYYHWHIEIVPKIKTDAGFELGTGLFVNPVDPDDAAQTLRSSL
jgi:UDPglucose--hexose-1-phosphate uridylyltransferase